MSLNIYTTAYDDRLMETLPIYKQYSQLLPLIGTEYDKRSDKVVFIGESHYLPEDSRIHYDPEIWYQKSSDDLNDTEKIWLSTRNNAGSGCNQKYGSKAYSIYRNLENCVLEHGFKPEVKSNLFRYWVYFNYFQRPAKTGRSLEVTSQDKEIAYDVLVNLVQILGIKHVFFLSKLAYNSFMDSQNNSGRLEKLDIHTVPHPGSAWWNRKSRTYQDDQQNPLSGKEYLRFLLNKYELLNS